MASGVACHHRPWKANTVERCRAWHAITAFGLADTVRRCRAWHAIIALGWQTQSNDIGRGMPSSPLDSTHAQTKSSVACHHSPWTENTIGRRRAWHAITAFRQHTWSKDVGRGMPSWPLDSKHGRTTSGVTCHHHLWTAHTVKRRRAWHAIIAFGQHPRSNDIGRDMPSLPLDSTHGWTTSGVA